MDALQLTFRPGELGLYTRFSGSYLDSVVQKDRVREAERRNDDRRLPGCPLSCSV